MTKKYRVDIIIHNRETGEQKDFMKDFTNWDDAYKYKCKILDNMEDNEYSNWKRLDVVVVCCGEELVCSHFTNTCDICESDYNMTGEKLAPREYWGEETGEHWSDCY